MALSKCDDGVVLQIKLSPKSSANKLRKIEEGASGQQLKVQVTAVPEDGKANAALIKLLSKTWKLPKTSFSIRSGATDRNKVLHIAGDPAHLFTEISSFIKRS